MTTASPDALRTTPRAILLDFGGVIYQTAKRPSGRDEFAAHVAQRLERAGHSIDAAAFRRSLDGALTALGHWKHASSRRREPREMSHREIVADFIAADLPEPARRTLVAEAGELLAEMNEILSGHELRPGIPALVARARTLGIPLGIVSNAHSGRSHRRLIERAGFTAAFGVQVYSDEVGIRKPHPRMIELAAQALGVDPADAWYVGDTQDRDLVAGRRAGVRAVILTTSKHTANPPFGIDAAADAVFDTPEGVDEALAAARPAPAPAAVASGAGSASRAQRGALLIDHGGVISHSVPDAELRDGFVAHLRMLLAAPVAADERELADADLRALLQQLKTRHREFKAERLREHREHGLPLREVTPEIFWRDLFGAELSERRRTVLEAEAADLTHRWGRAKSRRTLRTGVRELLAECRELAMPVVVVSNTVSGRAVRDECRAHGIDDLIGAYVCSDEMGVRKPDPQIVEEALVIADADPALSWFYGDKPQNDADAASLVGIGRRVIVRGGSTDDDAIETAALTASVTDVVDDARALAALIRTARLAASAA